MEQNSGTEVYKYTEVFRSPSEHEFATFCFDEKTCEIAMRTSSRIFFIERKNVNYHCDFTKKFAKKYALQLCTLLAKKNN